MIMQIERGQMSPRQGEMGENTTLPNNVGKIVQATAGPTEQSRQA